jgi:alpha-L-fucosidase
MNLRKASLKAWQNDRLGMFIHWGLYTIDGLDCWKMYNMGMPIEEYIRKYEPRFNPKKFNAAALADLAKRAGCKYVVMGTRHHEGYCLWNTATTRLSSVNMTPQRDFIAEYVQAMRDAGLKVGLYYSLLDWRYSAYFDGPKKNPKGWASLVKLVHAQVREIMTNYGKIDILWYDGAWAGPNWGFKPSEKELGEAWKSKKLDAMARRLQPGILLNNRSYPLSGGDFSTPEQKITPEHRPWELCDTMGHYWGAAPEDLNRKSVREMITRLITCVSLGGNMLLNIGPKADGGIQPWQARNMERIGEWLARHGEAIYGCEGVWERPFSGPLAPWRTTRKGNTLYLHLLRYPGQQFAISSRHDHYLKSAVVLTTGQRLKIKREPTRDIISGLPAKSPDPIAAVVKVNIRPKTAAEKRKRQEIGLDDPEGMFL